MNCKFCGKEIPIWIVFDSEGYIELVTSSKIKAIKRIEKYKESPFTLKRVRNKGDIWVDIGAEYQ